MTSPASKPINRHHIKLALGGMRFDKDLDVGWQITPSIGIVAKDIARMGLVLESFKEPLSRAIKQVMIPSFQKNFEVGGRPTWPPLAEFTQEVKGITGGGGTLIRSGALRRAVGMLSIWDIGNTSATIRSLPENVWYGAIHQSGYGGFGVFMAAAKKKLGPRANPIAVRKLAFALNDKARGGTGKVAGGQGIPQRQFILFQEEDIDDVQQVFYEWMVEQTILVGRFSR